MNKLGVIFLLLATMAGCVSIKPQTKTPHIDYPVFLETADKDGLSVFQLPKHYIALPIRLFTWYPNGVSAVQTLAQDVGIMGEFIWHDDCLLFQVVQTNQVAQIGELITPIFWVNSIKDYQVNGKSLLIRHDDKEIELNVPYHIDVNPEPKQNNRTDWIVQRGKDNCLMDKVVYLPSSVVDAVWFGG